MQMSFIYQDQTVEFIVEYRQRKTMAIQVEAPDKVIVLAPVGTTKKLILEKVKGNAPWIAKKLESLRNQPVPATRQFTDGELFLYLGASYPLQVQVDELLKKPAVYLDSDGIRVITPTRDEIHIRNALEQWYRQKCLERVNERIEYYQQLIKRFPNRVVVKEQKRRWGSCSSKGNLNFNWRDILAPSPVLDYIVVHEICHLVHLNHSKEFWRLVESILPDYRERKGWLKKNGASLNI